MTLWTAECQCNEIPPAIESFMYRSVTAQNDTQTRTPSIHLTTLISESWLRVCNESILMSPDTLVRFARILSLLKNTFCRFANCCRCIFFSSRFILLLWGKISIHHVWTRESVGSRCNASNWTCWRSKKQKLASFSGGIFTICVIIIKRIFLIILTLNNKRLDDHSLPSNFYTAHNCIS